MLQKQVITIPLAKGLDTKTDEFQVAPGSALELENARFYKTGKLQKRFGSISLPETVGVGTLADYELKAVVSDDSAINLVTDSGVLSYVDSQNRWDKVSEITGTPKIRTEFLSKSARNQYNPDCDYNPALNMTATCYVGVDESALYTVGGVLTVVLEDNATGLKKIRKIDTDIQNSNINPQKVMLVEYGGELRVLLFAKSQNTSGTILSKIKLWVMDSNLQDVSSVATLETVSVINDFTKLSFDVTKDDTYVYFAFGYENVLHLKKFDFNGTQVASINDTTTNRIGNNTVFGKAGFSVTIASDTVHVVCTGYTDPVVTSGLIAKGYSKALVNTITETYFNDTSFIYHDVSIVGNGSSIAVAANIINNGSGTPFPSETAYYTLTFGASYTFTNNYVTPRLNRTYILSRPFVYNGSVCVLAKCAETDQNTGLVLNLDTAKIEAAFSPFALSENRINGVIGSNGAGTSNAVLSGNNLYSSVEKSFAINTNEAGGFSFSSSIAIASIVLDFSTDYSAGTKVKIGETLYYTNGVTVAIDSRGAYESGFNLKPFIRTVVESTGTANPNITSKTFSYIAVYEFFNGKGELERSIPSLSKSITTGATAAYISINVADILGTFKSNDGLASPAGFAPVISVYRTKNNGSTFYKVASVQSEMKGADIQLYDAESDTKIGNNQLLYTVGGILENDSTPNAKFSVAGGNRLFLGGLEEEDEIAYSKKQVFGEAVAFSDFLRIRIASGTSSDRSRLSALGYMDGKLVIFRQNSIYYVAGDGPLETGAQDTFTDPEVVSSDTGCEEPRSVINIPSGLLFKSKKGIYLLDRSFQVNYVGAPVEAFNDERVISSIVSDKYNEARFYTDNGNCLVYNYLFDAWSVFKNQTTVDADIWAGNPVQVISGIINQEDGTVFTDDSDVYAMRVKTPWLKLNGMQDFGRIWSATILGKYKSAHTLNVKVYYDYDSSYFEEFNITPAPSDAQYQYRIHLQKQKCEALQFEVQDASQVGESMDLSAITLEVGLKKGSMKLGAARKY